MTAIPPVARGITFSTEEGSALLSYYQQYCTCTDTIGEDPCHVCHKPKEQIASNTYSAPAEDANADYTVGRVTLGTPAGGGGSFGAPWVSPNGYNCTRCGQWVTIGTTHICAYTQPTTDNKVTLDFFNAKRIADSFARIAEAHERMADAVEELATRPETHANELIRQISERFLEAFLAPIDILKTDDEPDLGSDTISG